MLLASEYEAARRMGAGPSNDLDPNYNRKRYNLQPKINNIGRDISRDVCYKCGKLGHHARACKSPPKAGLNAHPAAR